MPESRPLRPDSDTDEVSAVPKKQRKRQYRWNPGRNIILLKEIQLHLPFTYPYGQIKSAWIKVADGFNATIGECAIDYRRAQEKFNKLVAKWRSDEQDSLRVSGTEEEYSEQEILLTELVKRWDDARETRDFEIGQNRKKIERDENEGEIIRRSAMRAMRRQFSDGDTPSEVDADEEKEDDDSNPSRKRRRIQAKADFMQATLVESQAITKSITQLTSTTEQAQKGSRERLILEKEYREKEFQFQRERLEHEDRWKEKEIRIREMEIEARQKENDQRIKILELEIQLRSLEYKS